MGHCWWLQPECFTPQRKPDEPPPDIFRYSPYGSEEEEDTSPVLPRETLPPGPLNPTVLFPHFGLRVVRLSGLSVVEHGRMQVPQAISLTEAQQEAVSPPQTTLERFLATLSDEQLKLVGSTQGLGMAQLSNREQKRSFSSSFPPVRSFSLPPNPRCPPVLIPISPCVCLCQL